MARIPISSAFVFATILVAAPFVQDQDDKARDAARAALVKMHKLEPVSLDLPTGTGAWAVRVIRTGGIEGRTVDVAVRSSGDVRCLVSVGTCADSLSSDSLQTMSALVGPFAIPEIQSDLSPACSDCFITRITLRRREPDGQEKTYFAFWDDVTTAKAPPELVRIARAALALPR